MVVHCIEIWTSTDIVSDKSPQELADTVDSYVQSNGGVLRDQETSFSKEQHYEYSTAQDNLEFEYYKAIIRLDTADEETFYNKKSKIKTDMENFLNNNFSVWQWRYHECPHKGHPRVVEKTRELPDGTTETYTEETYSCAWQASNHSNKTDIPNDVQFEDY